MSLFTPSADPWQTQRFNMVEQQIRPWNVLDQTVLDVFMTLRREAFVAETQQSMAFMDIELPILTRTHQTPEAQQKTNPSAIMLSPKVEARLLQEMMLSETDRVLEIGTGSGFMAAAISQKVDRVISIEVQEDIASLAKQNLSQEGIDNVEVMLANGFDVLGQLGQFDAVLFSGSLGLIPDICQRITRPGGKIIAITGSDPIMQAVRMQKNAQGAWQTTVLFDTVAPRLIGAPDLPRFEF